MLAFENETSSSEKEIKELNEALRKDAERARIYAEAKAEGEEKAKLETEKLDKVEIQAEEKARLEAELAVRAKLESEQAERVIKSFNVTDFVS